MTTLRDLLRATTEKKPITLLHEQWLQKNANPVYSPEAIELARAVLSGEKGGARDRLPTLRASGTGMCSRKRLFDLAEIEGIRELDGLTANIFGTGNFLHLKWQMYGLTAGWLMDAEVPVTDEERFLSGTMDGIVYDGSIFEFKSINSRGFADVIKSGPKSLHIYQTHAYMLISKRDKVSIVYENKDTSDWIELIINRNEEIIEKVENELSKIVDHKIAGTLPEMLPDCVAKTGYVYRGCAYRENCPLMEKLP